MSIHNATGIPPHAGRPDLPVYVNADHRLHYDMAVRVMSVLQQAGAGSVGQITESLIFER